MILIAVVAIIFVLLTGRRAKYPVLPIGAPRPAIPFWLFLAAIFVIIYGALPVAGVFQIEKIHR